MDISDYSKISEQIMILGNNACLRLCVLLTRKTQEQYKKSFYAEYQYPTNKYVDAASMITIKKDYDYFLTLDIFDTKDYIILRAADLFKFKILLKEIYTYFIQNADKIIKYSKDGEVLSVSNKFFILNDLPMGRVIEIRFIYMEINNSIGFRVYTSQNSYTDCNLNDLYALMYLINNFNLFQSAQTAVASLYVPMGTNLNVIGDANSKVNHNVEKKNNDEILVSKKRKLHKNSKSFFDKMDEM